MKMFHTLMRLRINDTESFNDWGGVGGFDDFVSEDVTRTAPSGDRTILSPTWSEGLPRIERLSQGGWSNMSPGGATFASFPPKTGTKLHCPPLFVEQLYSTF